VSATTRTTLVTGASRGIGRAVAAQLAARGDVLYLVAHHEGALAETARALGVAAKRTLAVDVGDAAAPARLAAFVGDARLDALVGVAGIALREPLGAITRDALDAQLAVNLAGPLMLTQALAPKLRDGASVVHVSSNLAHRPVPGALAYAASKAGLEGAVRGLAVELAPRRIRVNAVALGVVRTDMTKDLPLELVARAHPLGLASPDEAATAILALLDTPWTTGSTLVVDGGALVHSPT